MAAFNYFETELLSVCFGDRLDGQYPTQIGFGLLLFGDSIVLEDKLFVLQRLPNYEVVLLGVILSLVLHMVDQTGDVAVFALQKRVFNLLFDFSQTVLHHLSILLPFLQLHQHSLIYCCRLSTASSHYLDLPLDVCRISLFAALFDILCFLNNNLALLAQTVFTLDVLKYLHGCLQAGELLKSQVVELIEEVFQL